MRSCAPCRATPRRCGPSATATPAVRRARSSIASPRIVPTACCTSATSTSAAPPTTSARTTRRASAALASITAPTPGNHDWPRHRDGYDPYWQRALRRPRAAAWYRFQAGGWTILSIASETAARRDSDQLALAARPVARARHVPARVLAPAALQRRHAPWRRGEDGAGVGRAARPCRDRRRRPRPHDAAPAPDRRHHVVRVGRRRSQPLRGARRPAGRLRRHAHTKGRCACACGAGRPPTRS